MDPAAAPEEDTLVAPAAGKGPRRAGKGVSSVERRGGLARVPQLCRWSGAGARPLGIRRHSALLPPEGRKGSGCRARGFFPARKVAAGVEERPTGLG